MLHEGSTREISLQWWIGADDRWYEPELEITSRQTLIRDLPIVSSSVRIPSGDAVATAFTTVQGPRELVVSELENRSKVPFAAALVVSGPGAIDVALDGTTIRCGSRPIVHLPSVPQRVSAASSLDAVRQEVFGGQARGSAEPFTGVGCIAVLFPVTHGTSIRVAAVLGADAPLALAAAPVLSALPRAHDLANGWDTHLSRGAVFRSFPAASSNLIPGPRSNPASYRTALASLLLMAEPAAADPATPIVVAAVMARALDSAGFPTEGAALLERVLDVAGRKGSLTDSASNQLVGHPAISTALIADAVARHGALTHNSVFAQALEPTLAGAIEFVLKSAKSSADLEPYYVCLSLVPSFFRVARDERAERQAHKILMRFGSAELPRPQLPPIPALSSGANFVPEEPLRLSELVRTHINAALQFSSSSVSLLTDLGEPDLGQPIDVRNLPTPWGRLSYALRWHGERPALLWECNAIHDDQRADDLVLRAPLFGDWTATGAKGDALLPPHSAGSNEARPDSAPRPTS